MDPSLCHRSNWNEAGTRRILRTVTAGGIGWTVIRSVMIEGTEALAGGGAAGGVGDSEQLSSVGVHRRQAMKAKFLVVLLAVVMVTSSVAACKRRSAAPPAMGKESTAVDTTKKR